MRNIALIWVPNNPQGLDSSVKKLRPATTAPARRTTTIPSNASRAEVRSRSPKQNEEKDNDDWARFRVLDVLSITSLICAETRHGSIQTCGKSRSARIRLRLCSSSRSSVEGSIVVGEIFGGMCWSGYYELID